MSKGRPRHKRHRAEAFGRRQRATEERERRPEGMAGRPRHERLWGLPQVRRRGYAGEDSGHPGPEGSVEPPGN